MRLCALEIKQLLISLLFQNHMALIIGVHALRVCLRLTCEYELHTLPNRKVGPAKDHGLPSFA